MVNISLNEIKKNTNLFLEKVKEGETILIKDDDKPIAEVKPIKIDQAKKQPFGLAEGDFIVQDNFNDPLTENITRYNSNRLIFL
jgi:antitoxin (DNA-binding transcriptional repressor) of toxin-antitoxin stability system